MKSLITFTITAFLSVLLIVEVKAQQEINNLPGLSYQRVDSIFYSINSSPNTRGVNIRNLNNYSAPCETVFPNIRINAIQKIGSEIYTVGDEGFIGKFEISLDCDPNERIGSRNKFEISILSSPTSQDVSHVSEVNGTILIATETGDVFELSENNWESVNEFNQSKSIKFIKVFNNSVYVLDDNNTLHIGSKIENDLMWEISAFESLSMVNDIYIKSDGIGFAVGHAGLFFLTKDFGFTWEPVTAPNELYQDVTTRNDLNTIHFLESKIGYIGGKNGYLLRTIDGGVTWSRIPFDINIDFEFINIRDAIKIEYVQDTGDEIYRVYTATLNFNADLAMKRIWNAISNIHTIGLSVTSDWTTASWGNFGMRDLGTEPRTVFNNNDNYNYYFGFLSMWDLIYQSINSAVNTIEINALSNLLDHDEKLVNESKSLFVLGLAHGYLGLLYDQAFGIQTISNKLKNVNNQNINELSFMPDVIQSVQNSQPDKPDLQERVDLRKIEFVSLSDQLQSLEQPSGVLPYDELIDLGQDYLEMSVTALENLESDEAFQMFSNFLSSDIVIRNVESMDSLVNSFQAAFEVYQARNQQDYNKTDWNYVLEKTQGIPEKSYTIFADAWESNFWYHEALIYSIYPGWGRVDQKVLNLIDPNYPSVHEGVDLPPLETSDLRFDTYFQHLPTNNFRPERGLYFFSNYRYSRYNDYIGPYSSTVPFLSKTELNLFRSEAILETGGSRAEAVELINKSRVGLGGLEAAVVEESDESLFDKIYYEYLVEGGPYGIGPISFYNNRRFGMNQIGTINHLPMPAGVLLENNMDVYTFGGPIPLNSEIKITPVNNNKRVALTPKISWTGVSTSTVDLVVRGGGIEISENNYSDTEYNIPDEGRFNYNTTYEVLLYEKLDGNIVGRNQPHFFTTQDTLFHAPKILNPKDSLTNVESFLQVHWNNNPKNDLMWSNFEGSRLQLSKNNFIDNNLELDTLLQSDYNNQNIYSTESFLLTSLDQNSSYFLRVATQNTGGLSAWSDTLYFRTKYDPFNNQLNKPIKFTDAYSKTGFPFIVQMFIDSVDIVDQLKSAELALKIPSNLNYDSLSISNELTYEINLVEDSLKIAFASANPISSEETYIGLHFTPNNDGIDSVILLSAKLNTTDLGNERLGGSRVVIDSFTLGDVDDNSLVEAFDASLILEYSVGIINEQLPMVWENWRSSTADVDQDGEILSFDASLVLQKVVGKISVFPSTSPNSESVRIEITDQGLKFVAPENIQALNIKIPEIDQVELKNPVILTDSITSIINKNEGLSIAVASTSNLIGDIILVPMKVFTNESQTIEITTYSDNTYKVHQVTFSGLSINDELESGVPTKYNLLQNYPNPFNPSTQIQYALPEATHLTLEVFNSVGQKVMEIVNGQQSAGYHTATFDASGLSSGVYLYKLTTPSFTQTKKMLLIK